MRTFRTVVPVVVAVCVLLLAGLQDAYAQKKKTTPTPKPQTTTQETPSAPSQPSPRMGNSLKDLLSKFKGELTTLGVLKQVEADYFAVEDDGVVIMYPMNTIRSIKVIKPAERGEEEEEEEPEPMPKLDIRLQ